MYYLINSSKGPVRFHAVGEPIVEIPADPESGIRYERNGHYVTADGESIARTRVDYLARVK